MGESIFKYKFLLFRTLSRCGLIYLSPPATRLAGNEKVNVEDSKNLACQEASRSVGMYVALGEKYETDKYKTIIYEDLHTLVVDSLGERFCRQADTYAEILGFTLMVSKYFICFAVSLIREIEKLGQKNSGKIPLNQYNEMDQWSGLLHSLFNIQL